MAQDYKIKQTPEDFIVREISGTALKESGSYAVFLLCKKNYSTERAVQAIAEKIHAPRKSIGYSGSKDKSAVTEQRISIKGKTKEIAENTDIKDIKLKFLGFSDQPISLGDHEGNEFEIVVRNITQKPKAISRFINYFGEQRFSINNAEVGKAIIQKDFKKAIDLMLLYNGKEEKDMREYLSTREHDYIGALKTIPWKNLTMYIHAYQSKLWNEMASELAANKAGKVNQASPALENHDEKKHENSNKDNIKIPLIGFATEVSDKKINKIVENILQREGIAKNDFVIRAIPDLTSDGDEREIYAEVKGLVIGELEDDEQNSGKKKVTIKFSLGKGSYATEVIKEMFS